VAIESHRLGPELQAYLRSVADDQAIADAMGRHVVGRHDKRRASRAWQAPIHMPILAGATLTGGPLAVPWADEQGLHSEAALQLVTTTVAQRLQKASPFARVWRRCEGAEASLPTTVAELVRSWARQWSVPNRRQRPRLWSCWSPMAEAMASGVWPCDCMKVQRHQPASEPLLLADKPSLREREALLVAWAANPARVRPETARAVPKAKGPLVCKRGREAVSALQQYHPAYMLRCLKASSHLKDQRNLERSAGDVLHMLTGASHAAVGQLFSDEGVEVPSAATLLRARVTLDVSCMLMER